MNRTEIITTKIKALWALKERKAWPRDPGVAGELIRQYINALSAVPEKELPAVLDYFFSEETTSMPQPAALSAFWWRQSEREQNKKPKPLTWSDLDGAAISPYGKGVLSLLKRRFGVSEKREDRRGHDYYVRRSHTQPLNQAAFTLELKELSEQHNVPWIGEVT